MAKEKHIVAIPTNYNIYETKVPLTELTASVLPPVVVLEVLVMQGRARKLATLKQFDMEETDRQEIDVEAPDPKEGLWFDGHQDDEKDEEDGS